MVVVEAEQQRRTGDIVSGVGKTLPSRYVRQSVSCVKRKRVMMADYKELEAIEEYIARGKKSNQPIDCLMCDIADWAEEYECYNILEKVIEQAEQRGRDGKVFELVKFAMCSNSISLMEKGWWVVDDAYFKKNIDLQTEVDNLKKKLEQLKQ